MDINRRSLIGGVALSTLAPSAQAAIRTADASRAQSSAMSELSRYVEQHRADWGLPGMTLCVVDRTGFTGFITSGWANVETRTPVGPDHLFEVGSISKMIAALSIATLQQEGKLSTQAKYSMLMPDVAIRDGADITLQHLLDHTSGLPEERGLRRDAAPRERDHARVLERDRERRRPAGDTEAPGNPREGRQPR